MKRVVITGAGIRSCIGSTLDEVSDSLQSMRSGLQHRPEYAEQGLRSQVAGPAQWDPEAIPRRDRRFMGQAAQTAALALEDAIRDAGLTEEQVRHPETGLIAGSASGSCEDMTDAITTHAQRGVRRLGPYRVPKIMTSTVSAALATRFGIQGLNYSITSACATSTHCIGHAAEQIMAGRQQVVFAGGGEEEHWSLSMMFDAMGALSTGYNDNPHQASRPFDQHRDGFVIAGGAGMLVLESLDHAQARGAPILAEIVGYGATSDGADMVAPNGDGARRCMQQAIKTLTRPVDYINAHATSTPVGDQVELKTIRELFPEHPAVTATKSLTGHSLGAAGVHELIYTLLMMRDGFISGTANLETPDEAGQGMNLPTTTQQVDINTALCNSFGFGGTNACLALARA